ncbi:MAG: DUF4258 domain-containing protein [Deltaproteobacteria bacterium]|nr:DUF4258 domain-containing protein [Deltaproteobacteria bacterium]
MKVVFSEHAVFEMKRRGIEKESVKEVVERPQQKIPSRNNKIILQSKYLDSLQNKEMLLRVIGKRTGKEILIITAYKTSRIDRYWQKEIIE